ncbi:hypothetical protein MAR_020140, partial [Mya arenaria]
MYLRPYSLLNTIGSYTLRLTKIRPISLGTPYLFDNIDFHTAVLPVFVMATPVGMLNCPLPFPFRPNLRTSLDASASSFRSVTSAVGERRRRM